MTLPQKEIVPSPEGVEGFVPGQEDPNMLPEPVAAPTPEQMEDPGREPSAMSEEELFDPIEGEEIGMTEEELFAPVEDETPQSAIEEVKGKLAERGFFTNLADRLVVGLGRTDKETLSLLKQRFPDSKIQMDDKGEVFIDNERFDKVEKSAEELAMDIADGSGEIVEGVVSLLAEMGVVVPGTLATAGWGLPLFIGAGAIAGGAVGVKARGVLVNEFGGETMTPAEEYKEMAGASAMNVAFLGLGYAAKRVGRGIADLWKFRKTGIVQQVAVINKEVDNVIKKIGTPEDIDIAGTKTLGAIADQKDKLGAKIGLFKQEAALRAQDKRFVPKNYLKSMDELFDDKYVSVDKITGKASMTDDTVGFGVEESKGIWKDLLDRHENIRSKIQTKGGLTVKELLDEADTLKDIRRNRSLLENKPKVGRVYGELADKIGLDRNKTLADNLTGTASRVDIDDAMKEYAENIDTIKYLEKVFDSKESGEVFVNAVIKGRNPKRIRDLKHVLGGADSPQWNMFTSSWINQSMEEATDITSGVFNAKKFLENISDAKIGRETRREILDDVAYRKVRAQAMQFQKISTKVNVLTEDPMSQARAALIFGTSFIVDHLPGTRTRALWDLTRSNVEVGDMLLDKGFLEIATDAISRREKYSWITANKLYKTLVNTSKKVKIAGREAYVETPATRNFLQHMRPDGSTMLKDVGDLAEWGAEGVESGLDFIAPEEKAPEGVE